MPHNGVNYKAYHLRVICLNDYRIIKYTLGWPQISGYSDADVFLLCLLVALALGNPSNNATTILL